MPTSKTLLLLIIASFAGVPPLLAQGLPAGCEPEAMRIVSGRLDLEPICDHYSPETKELRLKRLEDLEQAHPVCYKLVTSDPKYQEYLRNTPTEIAEAESWGDSGIKADYMEVVKSMYLDKCASSGKSDLMPGTEDGR